MTFLILFVVVLNSVQSQVVLFKWGTGRKRLQVPEEGKVMWPESSADLRPYGKRPCAGFTCIILMGVRSLWNSAPLHTVKVNSKKDPQRSTWTIFSMFFFFKPESTDFCFKPNKSNLFVLAYKSRLKNTFNSCYWLFSLLGVHSVHVHVHNPLHYKGRFWHIINPTNSRMFVIMNLAVTGCFLVTW